MQNIIAGLIVAIVFALSLYFSLRGGSSSCSSCSSNSSCHSKTCSTKKYDKSDDLQGLL